MQRDRLPPEVIRTDNRLRSLDEQAVARLTESIARIGLQTPISVRWCHEENAEYSADLIAGLHRLEACKRLGLPFVDVVVHDGDEREARLWEIAENLHRAELTALERDEHVAEWIRLTDGSSGASCATKPGAGRHSVGGVRAAARELGIDRDDARRAVKVDGLSPEAKAAAREAGLDDNRSAMLRAAAEPNPAAQLAAMKREAEAADVRKANAETDKLVKERRIEAVKEWLARRLDVTEMHDLGEMLAGICEPLSKAMMREAA